MRGKTTLIVAVGFLVLALATHGVAVAQPEWEATYKLVTTKLGEEVSANGWSQMGASKGREFFAIQMFAKIDDKSELLVMGLSSIGKEWFTIGKIQMSMGSGTLTLWQTVKRRRRVVEPPPGVFPVANLERVMIYDTSGAAILVGDFVLVK